MKRSAAFGDKNDSHASTKEFENGRGIWIKAEVSILKRFKCFPFTLRRKKFNLHLDLYLRIQDNLTSSSVSYSSGLKSVLKKLHFRGGLVGREGLSTVGIKLSFQFAPAHCGRCLNVNATTLTATKTSPKRSLVIRTLAMHVRIFCRRLLYEIEFKYAFSNLVCVA